MNEYELSLLHRRFRRYRRPEDGDRLLKHHHGFAVQIARRHTGVHLSMEDAVATALRGLYEALKRYDPDTGAFTTFAYWWIFKFLVTERTFSKNVVRIPSKVVRQSRKVQRLLSAGRSEKEVAREMSIDVDQVERLAELHRTPTGQHIEQDNDTITDPRMDSVTSADLTERESMLRQIEEAMEKLDKRAQHIVRSRHAPDPLSFTKLGKIHGLSRQRIRDIYALSVKKLKWHCRKA